MEPRENSHLNVNTATSSDTYLDTYNTLNYKMAERRNVAHLSFEKKNHLIQKTLNSCYSKSVMQGPAPSASPRTSLEMQNTQDPHRPTNWEPAF